MPNASLKIRAPRAILAAFSATMLLSAVFCTPPQVRAVETWEKLDKRLKQQIFHLNVGLKLRSKDGLWIYLSDMSPKLHYAVFSTSAEDRGYRVIGFGSTFPVKSALKDNTYFLTSRHVIDNAEGITKECQRFFAAMKLYAEQSGNGNPDARYKQLLAIVNLGTKPMDTAERAQYQATVDAIWDTYENNLSLHADPARVLFNKYSKANEVQSQQGYFLHAPGPVTQQPLEAKIYKIAKTDSEPDLAILSVADAHVAPLELDNAAASEGQEIQVIGYPTASEQLDVDKEKYYAPTFSTGRVSRVGPHILQVDAPITSGNSGGPVVSLRGKALGVVAMRAMSAKGGELANFGGAVPLSSIQSFAPELFPHISGAAQ